MLGASLALFWTVFLLVVHELLELAYYRFEYGYNVMMAAGYILDPAFLGFPHSDMDNEALLIYARKYFGTSEPGKDPVSKESLTTIELHIIHR